MVHKQQHGSRQMANGYNINKAISSFHYQGKWIQTPEAVSSASVGGRSKLRSVYSWLQLLSQLQDPRSQKNCHQSPIMPCRPANFDEQRKLSIIEIKAKKEKMMMMMMMMWYGGFVIEKEKERNKTLLWVENPKPTFKISLFISSSVLFLERREDVI